MILDRALRRVYPRSPSVPLPIHMMIEQQSGPVESGMQRSGGGVSRVMRAQAVRQLQEAADQLRRQIAAVWRALAELADIVGAEAIKVRPVRSWRRASMSG